MGFLKGCPGELAEEFYLGEEGKKGRD